MNNPFLELEANESQMVLPPRHKKELMAQVRLITYLVRIAHLFSIDAGKTFLASPDIPAK